MHQDWGGYFKHGMMWDTVADCETAERLSKIMVDQATKSLKQENDALWGMVDDFNEAVKKAAAKLP